MTSTCRIDLQYGEHRDVGVHGVVEQQRDPVTRPGAAGQQVPGESVGVLVELAEGQGDVAGVDGEVVDAPVGTHPVAAFLEDVVEALAAAGPRALRVVGRDQDGRAVLARVDGLEDFAPGLLYLDRRPVTSRGAARLRLTEPSAASRSRNSPT